MAEQIFDTLRHQNNSTSTCHFGKKCQKLWQGMLYVILIILKDIKSEY